MDPTPSTVTPVEVRTGALAGPTGGHDGLPERLAELLAVLVDAARGDGGDGGDGGDDRAGPSRVAQLSPGECLAVVGTLERVKAAAAAVQASATAAFVAARDAEVAGARSAGEISARLARQRRSAARAEVALARRCSPGQADRHVGLARALAEELPSTREALARGDISEWRATLVVRETACLSADDRRAVDARLAPDLTDGTLGDQSVAAAARRASAEIDAASVVERHRRAVAGRCVSV